MEDAQLEISDTPKSPSEMFGKLQELTNELRSEGGDVARTIALALLIYDLAKREKMLAIIRWIKEEFILENQSGAPVLKSSRRIASEHQIEQVGAKLRDMMPWIKKNKLVDQVKN